MSVSLWIAECTACLDKQSLFLQKENRRGRKQAELVYSIKHAIILSFFFDDFNIKTQRNKKLKK